MTNPPYTRFDNSSLLPRLARKRRADFSTDPLPADGDSVDVEAVRVLEGAAAAGARPCGQ